ncbi:MAG: hypothetical protein NPIRA02_40570 [Nitrospirales bacterium]|nr:MAG: hypothetical protein NPIRA02_40570 [Nitrospirales bacterium]
MQAWNQRHERNFSLAQEIHVWRIFLQTGSEVLVRAFEDVLDVYEISRARKFFSPLHRRRFIVTHGACRFILAKYLGWCPEQVRFKYGELGKPRLVIQDHARDLRFNLSHSHDYALLTVTLSREVGVDVELVCDSIECEDIASMACSPCEITLLAQVPEPLRREAFFICWTRKEAFLKAKGIGLNDSLKQVDVRGPLRFSQKPFLIDDPFSSEMVWTRYDLEVHHGYQASLVCEGEECFVRYFDYQFLGGNS